MYRFRVVAYLCAIFMLCGASVSYAAPRDKAANTKIDEAVNKYYLATEFNRAEAILTGTLQACEDRCSPPVKARAWMYIGIVRGSGKQDIGGAQDAFQQALALDPGVALDDALATPAVKEAFESAASVLGETGAAATNTGGAVFTDEAGDADLAGEMECTPGVRTVETRRAIPVACTTDEPASRVTLRYKVFGGQMWQSVQMTRKGQYWQGEIPCRDTGIAGTLRWFVRAQDRTGDTVDSYGTKKQSAQINLVNATNEAPPAYPGKPPPVRCADVGACPEDMIGTPACPDTGGAAGASSGRGNKGWGASCEESIECESGLLCMKGDNGMACDSAPSCDSTAECPQESECISGMCDIVIDESGPSGPYKKNWFGLHAALDIAYISGTDICTNANRDQFSCFFGDGVQYGGNPSPVAAGNIDGGTALGTARVLASYERALSGNIGAEARVGFAFLGGPKPETGNPFLPIHAEGRLKYWFGKNAFARKGIRPYVFLGGGIAQVDARLTVTVYDCPPEAPNCIPARGETMGYKKLDAYKKLGLSFASGGGGAMYAIGANHGLILNLNIMYMMPSSGPVVEPSLGYQLGL